jgi:hypothetical protein
MCYRYLTWADRERIDKYGFEKLSENPGDAKVILHFM